MKQWLSMLDYDPGQLAELVQLARRLKQGGAGATALRNRILTMVFFNPSLRTRTSFEAAMLRFGGHAICLSVGGDTWQLEYRDGVAMDGGAAEHIREAAPVLSRYGDALAVRTFAGLRSVAEDAKDVVIRAFGRFATVPGHQHGIRQRASLPGAGGLDDDRRAAGQDFRQAFRAHLGAACERAANGRRALGRPGGRSSRYARHCRAPTGIRAGARNPGSRRELVCRRRDCIACDQRSVGGVPRRGCCVRQELGQPRAIW